GPMLLAVDRGARRDRLVHHLAPIAYYAASLVRRNTLQLFASISTATSAPTSKSSRGWVFTRSTRPEGRAAEDSLILPRKRGLVVWAGAPGAADGARSRMFSGRIDTSTLSPAPAPPSAPASITRLPASSIVPAPLRTSRTLPDKRFTRPMKSATMRFAGRV